MVGPGGWGGGSNVGTEAVGARVIDGSSFSDWRFVSWQAVIRKNKNGRYQRLNFIYL
jgi:hypothetical protein